MSETYKGMTAAEWAYIADNQGAALLAITEALGCDDHEVIQTIEHLKAAAEERDNLRAGIEAEAHEIGNAYVPVLYFAKRMRDQGSHERAGLMVDGLKRIAASHERLKALHRGQPAKPSPGAQEAAAFMAGDRWMSPAEVDAIRCDWPSVIDERGVEVE